MILASTARVVALLSAAAVIVAFAGVAPVGAVGGGSSGNSSASNLNVIAKIASAQQDIRQGWYSEAIQTLQSVVEQDKQNADAYNLLGFASRKLERTDDAAKYYEAALTIDPDHLGVLEYQGELFLMLDDLEKASANLARLLELCGANCHEYLDLKSDIASYQGS